MKYGFVYKIEDTPKENVWKSSREIELKNGSIVFGCEGDFTLTSSKGKMWTVAYFQKWLSENQKQEEI